MNKKHNSTYTWTNNKIIHKTVNDVCKNIFAWWTPSTTKKEYYAWWEIPWLKSWEINFNTLHDTETKITELWLNNSSAKIITKKSVVIAMTWATVARSGVIEKSMASNQSVCAMEPNNDTNYKYLYYCLAYNYNKIKSKTQGAMTSLNLSMIKELEIPIFPLPEQEAIANILWKVDETIEKTQNMIEKLELRNKWLEQKLLKNDTWEYKPIEKIASEFSKRNKEDKNIIVLSCTKYDWLVPSLEYFWKKIFSDNLTTYKLIPKWYFAYATNHIEEWSIWYQDKYEEAIISPMYTVFKTNNEINDYFLFRVLKTHKYILEYKKRMEWSIDRRWGLRRNVFSKIMVPVPMIEEQNKIMNILNKATEQLNLYKQKLEKLQELKKWLMQQLLTWKVRVKEFRN